MHHREIQAEDFKSLAEGDKVDFEVEEDGKGPKAKKVVKA